MALTATLSVHCTGVRLGCTACLTTVDIDGGDWRNRVNLWAAAHRMPQVISVHTNVGSWRRRD